VVCAPDGLSAICDVDPGPPDVAVEGASTADPATDPDAVLYDRLPYDRLIEDKLGVMDTNAIVLCRDQGMPIRVFNVYQEGNLKRLVQGEPIGTLVS